MELVNQDCTLGKIRLRWIYLTSQLTDLHFAKFLYVFALSWRSSDLSLMVSRGAACSSSLLPGIYPGSVQFSSITQLCPTLCDPMNPSTPGLPVHHQLLEFTQTHVHRVGDTIQPSHPLLSPSPDPNSSQHQGLLNESTLCIRWPKYWSFRFSISPSNEHPGLISFRMDWLDLLAVQRTLKSLKTLIF